jgi:hypothetical protein
MDAIAEEILAELKAQGVACFLNDQEKIILRPEPPASLLSRVKEHRDALKRILKERTQRQPEERPHCWQCGAPPAMPDIDEQLDRLRHEMAKRGWQWEPREYERLRGLLKADDVLGIMKVIAFGNSPMQYTVRVIRDGKVIDIGKKEVLDS